MNAMALTRELLLAHLEQKLGVDTREVNEQTPLFTSGLIDSFSLVDLIMFIETSAGIRMETLDVSFENLDSIERILRYVDLRTRGG
jgi:acyl carrier protein